jgi:hypothetical protein
MTEDQLEQETLGWLQKKILEVRCFFGYKCCFKSNEILI